MQISIADEMIEKMVREQVKARVNQYFGELKKENYFFLEDNVKNSIRTCVQAEIENILNEGFINKVCNDLAKSNLQDQIVERFAMKIASAFEEN